MYGVNYWGTYGMDYWGVYGMDYWSVYGMDHWGRVDYSSGMYYGSDNSGFHNWYGDHRGSVVDNLTALSDGRFGSNHWYSVDHWGRVDRDHWGFVGDQESGCGSSAGQESSEYYLQIK